ncbi:MAG: M15 family metallopeptidase [Clostridia bacterium]|nr:M15 family metallopeptidase [Clostridia bacterium]
MNKKGIIVVVIAVVLVCLCFYAANRFGLGKDETPTSAIRPGGSTPLFDETTRPDTELVTQPESGTAPQKTVSADSNLTGRRADNPFDSAVVDMPNDESWRLVLVNRWYQISETYKPTLTAPLEDSACKLDARVSDVFRQMAAAAKADGVQLTIAAGYISLERQAEMFAAETDRLTAKGMDAAAAAAEAAYTVLPAGCSENNLGIAVDLGWFDGSFADSPVYAWLCAHAGEYGFIERYTKEKEEITMVSAAPWHWRYVGVQAAAEMAESGQCLEEYLGRTN